jgi:putative lipoprotein
VFAGLALLAFGAAACGSDAGDPSGRMWLLTELNGSPALAGTQVTISFADDAVSGSAGCNTYSGPATWSDGDLSVPPGIGVTKMACDQPIMDQEQAFLAVLGAADEYAVDGDELRLIGGGSVVARFSASAS